MPVSGERPLAGVHVLVTRPAHQAEGLARAIEVAGGVVTRFPTMEIAAPRDPAAVAAIVARLDQFDLAIFISPNAVERTMALVENRSLPAAIEVACVGAGSAAALARFGINPVAPDDNFGADALLKMPRMQQVVGQRVVIFRGEGGRELLADALRARGAIVECAECYRRVPPRTDPTPLLREWERAGFDLVIVTSAEGLRNLHALLPRDGWARLVHTPILVVSAAQATLWHELGGKIPAIVARAATDDAILEAMARWRASARS